MKYDQFKEKLSTLEIVRNPRDSKKAVEDCNNVFSVWLPHGLSENCNQRRLKSNAHIRRARDIIQSYDDMIGNSFGILVVLPNELKSSGNAVVDFPSQQIFSSDIDPSDLVDPGSPGTGILNENGDDLMPEGFWD